MTGKEFKAALQAKGWTITETARGMHCTDPYGGEFVYNHLQAVRYGTWHDVAKCMELPLPDGQQAILPVFKNRTNKQRIKS